jgi:hypothetical protein
MSIVMPAALGKCQQATPPRAMSKAAHWTGAQAVRLLCTGEAAADGPVAGPNSRGESQRVTEVQGEASKRDQELHARKQVWVGVAWVVCNSLHVLPWTTSFALCAALAGCSEVVTAAGGTLHRPAAPMRQEHHCVVSFACMQL